jgi:hypothetical protein
MFVCCECCVLSGRGLYDELITRPEKSYWLWCVVVWSRNLVNEESLALWGLFRQNKKSKYYMFQPLCKAIIRCCTDRYKGGVACLVLGHTSFIWIFRAPDDSRNSSSVVNIRGLSRK